MNSGKLAPGLGSITLQTVVRAQQNDRNLKPRLMQQPRRGHPVAAIIAAPAQYRDPPRAGKLFTREGRHDRCCIPHKFKRGYSQALRSGTVAGLHFGC
jgi:hypothetical protein